MYHPNSPSNSGEPSTLQLLEDAADAPSQAISDDPEVREAFDTGLRQLAEDILQYHPDIAHILLGMGESPTGSVHGQN